MFAGFVLRSQRSPAQSVTCGSQAASRTEWRRVSVSEVILEKEAWALALGGVFVPLGGWLAASPCRTLTWVWGLRAAYRECAGQAS